MSSVSVSSFAGSRGRVAVVSMDRDPGNALDRALCLDLARALDCVQWPVRTVVLCPSVEHFSVGADLRERMHLDDTGLLAARAAVQTLTSTLISLPYPLVAAIHGYALGGGLELALAADVVISEDTAELGLPEARIGIVPGAGGTQLLARRVGWGVASEIALSGRRLGAAEARSVRLVDRVVDAGEALDAACELANSIAENNPRSTKLIKRAMHDGVGLTVADALAVEDAAWRQAAMSGDYREGLTAFSEGRLPRWSLPDDTASASAP